MNFLVKLSIFFAFLAILYYSCFHTKDKIIPKCKIEYVAPGWQGVADTFSKQIESGHQEGGAFAVYHKGKLVVDVYGGFADDDILLEWSKDTICQFFSTTKAVGALVMAMLVDRGLLDYKKPVSKYWPEFAQNGKADITVEQLLSHQAGLPAIDKPYNFKDVGKKDKELGEIFAAQKPFWKVGEGAGYHALTIGVYEDQIVRRVDPKGRSLNQYYIEEIKTPFEIDFYIGLPKKENYRCARNVHAKTSITDFFTLYPLEWMSIIIFGPGELFKKVFETPSGIGTIAQEFNHPSMREVPLASSQGFGTARAVAKLFGILGNGGKYEGKTLLSENLIKMLQEPLTNGLGLDLVLSLNMTYGRGVTTWPLPEGHYIFGAPGAGGQMGVCDPDNDLGIAYVTNHHYPLFDPKYVELADAVYKTLQEF